MTPERYRKVREIFHAVVDLEAAQRSALIGAQCADDPSLRAEVESLLEEALSETSVPGRREDASSPGEALPLLGLALGSHITGVRKLTILESSAEAAWGPCIWRRVRRARCAGSWR